MEEKLQVVFKEYIGEVEGVCKLLIKSINDSENTNLRNKYDFFEYRSRCKKTEFEVGEVKYRLHGKGCTVFNQEKVIEWDFGYRSRWCGIDPWKVSMTLKKNCSPHAEFYDVNLLQTACEQFVKDGIMFKKYDQYYFELTENETLDLSFQSNMIL